MFLVETLFNFFTIDIKLKKKENESTETKWRNKKLKL